MKVTGFPKAVVLAERLRGTVFMVARRLMASLTATGRRVLSASEARPAEFIGGRKWPAILVMKR